jgi:hypothetical protein
MEVTAEPGQPKWRGDRGGHGGDGGGGGGGAAGSGGDGDQAAEMVRGGGVADVVRWSGGGGKEDVVVSVSLCRHGLCEHDFESQRHSGHGEYQ